jgi:hypothetical protein
MLYLEIQQGKAEMPKWSACYRKLGVTASYQKEIDHHQNCIIGDS